MIYIPGQKNIELSRDVIFEENLAFKRAQSSLDLEVYIPTPSLDRDRTPELQRENLEETMSETQSPPRENLKKIPLWATKTVEEAQKFVAPLGTFRESKRPNKFTSYVALMNDLSKTEPNNVSDALEHLVWKDAMSEEYQSIMKNDVWEIVPRPTKKPVVSSKWLFKIKHVARGFSQREGIDYEETFAPDARYTSVRAVLAIAATKGWKVHQMDVKTTFLNGEIEEVYLEQLEGFKIHDPESHVCRLKKALYGLKQAPRAWYERIDTYLSRLGFSKNDADPNLYYKRDKGDMLILILYVDDLLITGNDHLIDQCKKDLSKEFDMKDLGLLHYFLGLEVWQNSDNIILNQGKYTLYILKRFGMLNCRPMTSPMETNLHKLKEAATESQPTDPTQYRQMIGSLMYLVNRRLDICYAVNGLSQFMCEPKEIHLVAVKHIMR